MTNKGTVVLVDDDEDVRHSMASLVESAGLDVKTYASAEAFLEADPPSAPACLVLYVRMPGMNGLELQQRLNELGIPTPRTLLAGSDRKHHDRLPTDADAEREYRGEQSS